MRVLIAAAGSRGDVAPFAGLGVALRGAGHEVVLATMEAFAPLVREAGLEFRPLPAHSRERGGNGGVEDRRELMRTAAAFVTELGRGFAEAVDGGTELLLLSATTAPLGWHLAEARGIPSLGLYLQPTAPTGDFPPVVTGSRSLGRTGNRLAGCFALRMADRVYTRAVGDLRRRLELPPLAPSAMRRRRERERRPVLHGFSPALVPRPSDWRPGLEVVGTWWPPLRAAERLPAEVEDFLGAGPRPVLLGFGSMAAGEGERLSGIAVRALRRAACAESFSPAAPGSRRTAVRTCSPSGTCRTPCCSRGWRRWCTTRGPVRRRPPCARGCPRSPCRSPRTSRSGRAGSPLSARPRPLSPSGR